jgi:hypothetical protein
MGMNQPSAQPVPTIRDGIREMMRDLRVELLPRIPRAAVLWGFALGAGFVIPGAYGLLKPASGSALSSGGAGAAVGFAICFCAGFQAAWHQRDFGHGGVVALVAILIGFCVAIAGGVAAVLVISSFRAIDLARALYGAIEVPLPIMLILGGSIGALGAAIAAGLSRFRPITVTQS